MKKTALFVIIFLAAGAGLTGYLMYNHEMPDQVAKEPDYILSAQQLLQEFESNKASASAKYTDKIIQLTGTLKNVDTSGAIVIGIAGKPDEIIMGIDPRYKKKLLEVTKGSVVTVQGVCSNYTTDEASSDDLLASLGATLRFRSGGIKQ
jgi:putative nucleic acid binding protein